MSKKRRHKLRARNEPPPPPDADPPAPPEAGPDTADTADAYQADQPAADLQAERDNFQARLERVLADYHNYQKRAQRDLAQAREYANEELMKAILSILDDMERALDAGRANHSAADPLLTGMQLVHDNALATLGKFGLSAIDALGRPFDPDQHAAMMQQPTADHPPQTVVAEVQKGYRLKSRTLRPSGVVVAAEPPPDRDD